MKNTKLNFLALDYSEVSPLNQYLILFAQSISNSTYDTKTQVEIKKGKYFLFGRVFKSSLSLGRIF